MYQVHDVMTTEVVTISPDATAERAIRILLGNGVSGAPVVDDGGRLVGIISEFRLLEIVFDPALRSTLVQDWMTEDVITVDGSALLGSVANLMMSHKIRRVPVISHGRLAGIVSRRDLLRYMLERESSLERAFDALTELEESCAV